VEKDSSKRFPLRHALQKVTSQHCHFQRLITFSHIPRLQNVVKCQLAIVTVPARDKHLIKMPEQVSEWREIVDTIAGAFYQHQAIWPAAEVQELFKKFSQSQLLMESDPECKLLSPELIPSYGVIHCECALIAYLATLRKNQKTCEMSLGSGRNEGQGSSECKSSAVRRPGKPKPWS